MFWNLGHDEEEEFLEPSSVQGRYKEACDLIAKASKHSDFDAMSRTKIERHLRRLLERAPYFELLYVTDAAGAQVIDNIAGPNFRAQYDGTGLGQDWSERPWYLAAVKARGAIVSPVYKSLATGELTLTIAHPIRRKIIRYLGVLAVDIGMKGMLR